MLAAIEIWHGEMSEIQMTETRKNMRFHLGPQASEALP